MNPTRNDLNSKTRAAVTALLNDALATLIDLQLQAKQAHWNVKGPNFIALHELFDSVVVLVQQLVDITAERVVALGGTAQGSLSAILDCTRLTPYPSNIVSGQEHVSALSDALAAAGKLMRQGIDQAVVLTDAVTADLFTEVARELDKQLWFVESHLQGDS